MLEAGWFPLRQNGGRQNSHPRQGTTAATDFRQIRLLLFRTTGRTETSQYWRMADGRFAGRDTIAF
jgi:hypothetical protein